MKRKGFAGISNAFFAFVLVFMVLVPVVQAADIASQSPQPITPNEQQNSSNTYLVADSDVQNSPPMTPIETLTPLKTKSSSGIPTPFRGVLGLIVVLFLLPSVLIGALTAGTYYVLLKLPSATRRWVPIAGALTLSIITPFFYGTVLVWIAGIFILGLLSPYMFIDRFFATKIRYIVVFVGSIPVIAGSLAYGFAMVFGYGGTSSLFFNLITPPATPGAVFLVLNSLALYAEVVSLAVIVFGMMYVLITVFQYLKHLIRPTG